MPVGTESLVDTGPDTPEPRNDRDHENRRRRTLAIMYALAVLSLLVFVVSLFYESNRLSGEATMRPGPGTAGQDSEGFREPPIEALYEFFPSTISGYATKAQHNAPYGAGLQAEAIYEPEDMGLQLASPLNVYCLLTIHESEDAARREIEQTALGFTVESATAALGQGIRIADMGYAPDRDRYFVGYSQGSLSLIIYSSYMRGRVPVEHRDMLRVHGQAVAEQAIAFMSQRLSGEE